MSLHSHIDLLIHTYIHTHTRTEKQFCTEFDYKLEALNLQEVRDAVMPAWHSKVVIPEPRLELCSKHILVMEYLQGIYMYSCLHA